MVMILPKEAEVPTGKSGMKGTEVKSPLLTQIQRMSCLIPVARSNQKSESPGNFCSDGLSGSPSQAVDGAVTLIAVVTVAPTPSGLAPAPASLLPLAAAA